MTDLPYGQGSGQSLRPKPPQDHSKKSRSAPKPRTFLHGVMTQIVSRRGEHQGHGQAEPEETQDRQGTRGTIEERGVENGSEEPHSVLSRVELRFSFSLMVRHVYLDDLRSLA